MRKGSNGKSLLLNLLQKVLDVFCTRIRFTFLNNKNITNNSASPELLALRNKKCAIMGE